MQSLVPLRRSLLVAAVSLVTACASGPRSSTEDAAFKRVVVVSLLDEQAQVIRTGLTVFNNSSAIVDLGGRANSEAAATVQSKLRSTRTDWTVMEVQPDRRRLLEKMQQSRWSGGVDAIADDLAALAKAEQADGLFVVAPMSYERHPIKGPGVWLRSPSNSTPPTVGIYAAVMVFVVDRNGKTITNRPGGNNYVSDAHASVLGITYDLSTLKDSSVQSRLSDALLGQLRSTLTTAMGYLGYR